MAGLEGIDASRMDIVDALGARWEYDDQDHVARPLVRHADRIPVAVMHAGEAVIQPVRFGMPGFQGRLITNARDDKLTTAASWKALLGKHHSLTALSYVVEKDKRTNTTYRIQRVDGGLIVVPGLAAVRHYSFASTGNEYDDLGHVQITTTPNTHIAQIHDRFVVDLDDKARRAAWLTATDADEAIALLRPAPDDAYEMVPVTNDIWDRKKARPDIAAPTGPALRPGQGQMRLDL